MRGLFMDKESGSEEEKINERIEKFNVYKEPFTRFLLYRYYIFVFIYLIIVFLYLKIETWWSFWNTGNSGIEPILAAIIVLITAFFSISMFKKIPNTLRRIWDRNIILSRGNEKDTQDKYITFLDNFEENLNSKWGVYWGFVCISILLLGVYGNLSLLRNQSYLYMLSLLIDLFFFGIYIFIFGMILYRMYVTAKYIGKMSQEFDLNVQVLHPDKCGGIKPIGDLCLSNSHISIPVGIFLAVETIFNGFQIGFFVGFIIVLVISIVVFVSPVYQIHKIMLKEKIKNLEIWDGIFSAQIPVINEPEKMELSEINKYNEYDVLLVMYREVEDFKTWPFHTSAWRKYIASEISLIFTWVVASSGRLGEPTKNFLTQSLKTLLGIP
jgi:hypothetical protein